jgi:hypothetical protein
MKIAGAHCLTWHHARLLTKNVYQPTSGNARAIAKIALPQTLVLAMVVSSQQSKGVDRMIKTMGFTDAQMLSDIKSHCWSCSGKSVVNRNGCTAQTCQFFKYRYALVQLNAFDGVYKECWMQLFEKTAVDNFSANGFFPSQIRLIMETVDGGKAFHPSWIGTACHKLTKRGWEKTGEHRVSPLPSCNGRHEYRFVYNQ